MLPSGAQGAWLALSCIKTGSNRVFGDQGGSDRARRSVAFAALTLTVACGDASQNGVTSTGAGGFPQGGTGGNAIGGAGAGAPGAQDGVAAEGGVGGTPALGGAGAGATPCDTVSGDTSVHVFPSELYGGFPSFRTPDECTSDADCSPNSCYLLTEEFGVCSTEQQEVEQCSEAGGITPYPADQCGCGGLSCAEDEVCVGRTFFCSCEPAETNVCVPRACEAASDCADTEVCMPPSFIGARCLTARCHSDAECTDGPDGRCAALIQNPQQAGELSIVSLSCVYKTNGMPNGMGGSPRTDANVPARPGSPSLAVTMPARSCNARTVRTLAARRTIVPRVR